MGTRWLWFVSVGLGLMLGGARADRQVLFPRSNVLQVGQFVVEGVHRNAEKGYIRYYFANVGVAQGTEIEVERLDYENQPDVTVFTVLFQYRAASPLMPGLTLGVRDLSDQDDKGLGRSFFVSIGQKVPLVGRKGETIYEYLSWGTGHLSGFWGGIEWRSAPLRLSVAVEQDPVSDGLNLEGRYEHPTGFRLKIGLYKGDVAFGLSYARGLW